jgi:hypothetical protein
MYNKLKLHITVLESDQIIYVRIVKSIYNGKWTLLDNNNDLFKPVLRDQPTN